MYKLPTTSKMFDTNHIPSPIPLPHPTSTHLTTSSGLRADVYQAFLPAQKPVRCTNGDIKSTHLIASIQYVRRLVERVGKKWTV